MARAHCHLLVLLALAARVRCQDNASAFRIIVRTTDITTVFSSDFTTSNSSSTLATLNRTYTGTSADVYNVSTTEGLSPQELCDLLAAQNPGVTLCEPDRLYKTDLAKVVLPNTSSLPDDPLFKQQWNMPRINLTEAWAEGYFGVSSVRVCMIDTGTDYTHPDIVGNLWTNAIELAGPGANPITGKNGLDDDGDGIVDDIYGANFLNGGTNGDPMDQNGHGTFVAGVVGAVGNNALGVTGVQQRASIISCRFMDATGNGWASDAIRCFDYCISKGAHILSNSWGGVELSEALQDAITSAQDRGVLVVTSAGNDGVNTDTSPHYPSSIINAALMSVAASDQEDKLWYGSNFGKTTVQLAAPGASVLSLGLGGLYVTLSGTSMACPHVSGSAALVLSKFQESGYNISTAAPNIGLGLRVKQILLASTDPMPGNPAIMTGRLNVQSALALVPNSTAVSGSNPFGATQPSPTIAATNPFGGSLATPEPEVTPAGIAAQGEGFSNNPPAPPGDSQAHIDSGSAPAPPAPTPPAPPTPVPTLRRLLLEITHG